MYIQHEKQARFDVRPARPWVDPSVWQRRDMRLALAARDIQAVYQLLQKFGVSQRRIAVRPVFAHFRRVSRPVARCCSAFHVGDEPWLKTQGYGGNPIKVYVHRRRPAQMTAWLYCAGFTVEAQMTLGSPESALGAILFRRRKS